MPKPTKKRAARPTSREGRGPETGPGLGQEVLPPGRETQRKTDRSESFDDDLVR